MSIGLHVACTPSTFTSKVSGLTSIFGVWSLRTRSFLEMVRQLRNEAREGRTMAMAILIGGRFAGQITLGGIAWGSLRSAYIGYWIDEAYAGRGYMPRAVGRRRLRW